MSWAAVGAVAAVVGTAVGGYSSYEANKTAKEQAQADADAQSARGRLEAQRILKQKEKQQSQARAAAAENGLDINEGTAVKINDEIEQGGQYDAKIAEQTGYNSSQRLQTQASQYGTNANTALVAGAINSVSVGANGYANYQKSKKDGWK